MNHELSVENFTTMAYSSSFSFHVILLILFSLLASQCSAQDNPTLAVDVKSRGRPISKKFFGVFFEVIINIYVNYSAYCTMNTCKYFLRCKKMAK